MNIIPPEDRKCIICGKPKAKLDTRCSSVSYCSSKCQASDWHIHKLVCKHFSEPLASPRPSSSHKRAILFPIDKSSPVAVWISVDNNDGIPSDALRLLGGDNTKPSSTLIQESCFNFRPALTAPVELLHLSISSSTSASNPAPVNKSIGCLFGAYFYRPHIWRGPVLALQPASDPATTTVPSKSTTTSLSTSSPTSASENTYTDITLTAFRHIVDHFATFGYPSIPVAPNKPVIGVQISSDKAPVPFTVPGHALHRNGYTVGTVLPISRRIGFPIRAWKWPLERQESKEDDGEYNSNNNNKEDKNDTQTAEVIDGDLADNMTASVIAVQCDPAHAEFGMIPTHWQVGVGKVLLMREDGKDLDAGFVETFCRWVEGSLWPDFAKGLDLFSAVTPTGMPDGRDMAAQRRRLADRITRAEMDAYGDKLRKDADLTALQKEVMGPEEAGTDTSLMLSKVRDAIKVDKEYGEAIKELADEGQSEYDLSYV